MDRRLTRTKLEVKARTQATISVKNSKLHISFILQIKDTRSSKNKLSLYGWVLVIGRHLCFVPRDFTNIASLFCTGARDFRIWRIKEMSLCKQLKLLKTPLIYDSSLKGSILSYTSVIYTIWLSYLVMYGNHEVLKCYIHLKLI